MELTTQTNLKQFNDSLAQFIREQGVGLPNALRYQCRLLADRLIRGPKGSGGGRGLATPPATRSQGKAAVARDIRRAIVPLTRRYITASFRETSVQEAILDLVAKDDAEGLQVLFSRFESGPLRDAEISDTFDAQMHQSQRDRRGRVLEKKSPRFATTDTDALADYVKRKQDNVGRAKGGWAASLLALGGSTSAWITKHSDLGHITDRADDLVAGYIRMTNESEWASGGDEDRIVSNALASRAQAILKDLAFAQEKAARKSFAS